MISEMSSLDLEAVARLRLVIVRLARRQRQAASSDLTPSQQSALSVIGFHGPILLGDLAEIEQVAPPTVTRIVAKLESQGLVERVVDADDRRFARAVITDVGRGRLDETWERRSRWLAERIEQLEPDDIAAVVAAVGPLERLLDIEPMSETLAQAHVNDDVAS